MADAPRAADTPSTELQQAPTAAARAPLLAPPGPGASASGSSAAAAPIVAGSTGAREVVGVFTAQALQQELLAGTPNIEVRSHLDLRSLPIPANPDIPSTSSPAANNPRRFALLYARESLESLRVRPLATAPPLPGAAGAGARAGICMPYVLRDWWTA